MILLRVVPMRDQAIHLMSDFDVAGVCDRSGHVHEDRNRLARVVDNRSGHAPGTLHGDGTKKSRKSRSTHNKKLKTFVLRWRSYVRMRQPAILEHLLPVTSAWAFTGKL